MSMGNPGFDPGAEAARHAQEAARVQQEFDRMQRESASRAVAEGVRGAQDGARIGREQAEFQRFAAERHSRSGGSKWGLLVVVVFLAVVGFFGFRTMQSQAHNELPGHPTNNCAISPSNGCFP